MTIENIKKMMKKNEPEPEFKQMLEYYIAQNLSFIPLVAGQKKPAVAAWEPFQKAKPTEKDIEKWFFKGAFYNIGIICGKVSENLVVLDFEDKKIAYKIFGKNIGKETFVVQSGSGKGLHVYYKTRFPVRKFKIEELALDVQGEGSYVAAPPSLHPSNRKYEPENFTGQPIAHWEGEDFEEDLYEKIEQAIKRFESADHRAPIDIEKILQGVDEGNRNQSCLHLATWYRKSGKDDADALKEVLLWNSKLKEPLDDREVERTVASAFKREPYHYFFKQDPEAFKEIEQFTAEELAEAETLLKAETKLKFEYLLRALGDIVHEDKTKVSLFMLELVEESVHVGGDSSAGKSHLCDKVVECYPKNRVWKITGMTDKSLRYLKDAVGTIYVAEFQAMSKGKKEEESTAQFDMKMIISEHKLSLTVVEKDPETKRFETKHYINPNVHNMITTSTDVDVTDELKNRMWELSVDESPEQTHAVKERRILERQGGNFDCSHEKKIIRSVTERIDKEAPKTPVIIPYAWAIGQIVSDEFIRARRDINKLFMMVESVTRFNYLLRPTWNGRLVSIPDDFYYAMQYMDEATLGTFSDMTPRVKRVWQQIKSMFNNGMIVSAETAMLELHCSQPTAYRWLERFERMAYISKIESTDRRKVSYQLSPEHSQSHLCIEMKDLFKATSTWIAQKMGKTGQKEPKVSQKEPKTSKIDEGMEKSEFEAQKASDNSKSDKKSDNENNGLFMDFSSYYHFITVITPFSKNDLYSEKIFVAISGKKVITDNSKSLPKTQQGLPEKWEDHADK